MTANTTQRAVALLRQTLPENLRPTPHLVATYSEALDGVAFCINHEGHTANECVHCAVIETNSPQLAALIVALLRAAAPFAAHLNAIDAWGHNPAQHDGGVVWSCGVCGPLAQPGRCPAFSAADITQAINTAVAR